MRAAGYEPKAIRAIPIGAPTTDRQRMIPASAHGNAQTIATVILNVSQSIAATRVGSFSGILTTFRFDFFDLVAFFCLRLFWSSWDDSVLWFDGPSERLDEASGSWDIDVA